MFQEHEWWWPDGETFLPAEIAKMNVRDPSGRLTYQHHKYQAALGCLREDQRRIALDVGAHVGLWSYYMARDFQQVVAFEPVEAHRECWRLNLEGATNVDLVPGALGASHRLVTMVDMVGHSGGTRVSPILEGTIEMYPLDYFRFQDVDLIKLDCEGYEAFVIAGATRTLSRCRPIVVVEQPDDGNQKVFQLPVTAAVDALQELGMRVITRLGSDYILGWS